eukprot:COSAG06_NODE_25929_length_625_cov_4.977186_1_plen_66_part_10
MAAVGVAMARGRWDTASTRCRRCDAEFGGWEWGRLLEHHCRLCGRKFCGGCSDKKLLLAPAPGSGG